MKTAMSAILYQMFVQGSLRYLDRESAGQITYILGARQVSHLGIFRMVFLLILFQLKKKRQSFMELVPNLLGILNFN